MMEEVEKIYGKKKRRREKVKKLIIELFEKIK